MRLPAHAVPPFRAEPWNWTAVGQLVSPIGFEVLHGLTFRVNFDPIIAQVNDAGPSIPVENDRMGSANSYVAYTDGKPLIIDDPALFPGFPEGWLGWISNVDVAVFAFEDVSTKPIHRYVRWSMLIDRVPVPGYLKTHASTTFAFVRPPSYLHQGATTSVLPLPLHVPIREKQQLDFDVFAGVNGVIVPWAVDVVVRANGYRIPSRAPDGTIYQTLTD